MSAPTPKQILVTHALPYANGPLHIGHLLGYIQTDVWVRAKRMAGDTVHFVAADDAHGTPIMLAAEKAGVVPEAFIQGMQASHERDFADFGVAHDAYYTTHSPENRELAELVYTRLRDGGHVAVRSIRQLYDPVRQMFLPDRYVKGICPKCGTPDQYGDNCENCGATYAPTDLKDPRSVLSGATPELRDSEHYFFKVGDFAAMLQDWLAGKLTHGEAVMHPSVAAKLKEWLDADGGVRDWDISRDAPYFGFPIPDAPGKFFYVWLDAPIGYLASFKHYCASEAGAKAGLTPASFDAFMQTTDPDFDGVAEMHHFIGKDIVNFHGLFWPAMLKGANLRTPNALHVNGYLTVNGEKMSKSRGTFVMARTYLDAGLDPDWLRYYFATMLTAAPVDLDLDLKAFEERVNSHLVGKWVNIASRCAGFVRKFFGGRLAAALPAAEHALYAAAAAKLAGCAALYEACDYAGAMRRIVEVADEANAYVADKAPWLLAKDEGRRDELHVVCTLALNLFRLLSIWLSPVVPGIAQRSKAFLGQVWQRFDAADTPLLDAFLCEFVPLTTRIDPKKIEAMIEASKESLKPTDAAAPAPGATPSPPNPPLEGEGLKAATGTPAAAVSNPQSPVSNPGLIAIDDFAKLDLRIGKVIACEFVDGSDKLLRFELDAGELGKRQIFSGIRAAYGEPDKLVGRSVVFIANLAPRKMRFGVSEGMILSAGSGGSDLFLLDADAGASPGMPVK
ncbi:MAG: methionine--tRNA ligase [Rhodanobacteraceae bacterium]|nr:methionine--tRNA ligase [Rhodanobacteraceae bacterium]